MRSYHLALWQFTVHLEPQWGGVLRQNDVGAIDNQDGVEASRSLFDKLDAWFARMPSWSESVVTWQSENGHQVQVVLESSVFAELTARIDLRRPAEGVVEKLLNLARCCHSQWVTDGSRILTSADDFGESIQSSPAARYVTDPRGFISASAQQSRSQPQDGE